VHSHDGPVEAQKSGYYAGTSEQHAPRIRAEKGRRHRRHGHERDDGAGHRHLVARVQVGQHRTHDSGDDRGRQRDEQAVHDGIEVFACREESDVVAQAEAHTRVSEVEVGPWRVLYAQAPGSEALDLQPLACRGLKQRTKDLLFDLKGGGLVRRGLAGRPVGNRELSVLVQRRLAEACGLGTEDDLARN